jgi:hypothetical protein
VLSETAPESEDDSSGHHRRWAPSENALITGWVVR